jgi:hypothetical protein
VRASDACDGREWPRRCRVCVGAQTLQAKNKRGAVRPVCLFDCVLSQLSDRQLLANDTWCDKDEQLGFVFDFGRTLKRIPEEGNIAQQRHL